VERSPDRADHDHTDENAENDGPELVIDLDLILFLLVFDLNCVGHFCLILRLTAFFSVLLFHDPPSVRLLVCPPAATERSGLI
jgi:hypothetical protein